MITVNHPISSLGDSLWLTPLFKNGREGHIIMHDNFYCRDIAQIYQGIATVEFRDKVGNTPKANVQTHETKRILLAHGIESNDCIPEIKITEEEIEWAKDFLKDYKNPIVVINDNSGCANPQNIRAQWVRPPVEEVQKITNELYSMGYTPIQFGLKENFFKPGESNFTPLNNAAHIRGLGIRKLAACYKVIGKYFGGDTGDYHLMLSVGGTCTVSIPSERPGYSYSSLLYQESFFVGKVRVRYILHDELNKL